MGSFLDNKSDSDTDLSDSEMDERAERTYQELRNGKHCVRNYDGTFNCPFCFKKRTQPYQYTDLLQHAFGVGHSSSDKRSVKEKANHQALVKYLENELAAAGSSSKPAPQSQPHAGCSREMGHRVGNSVCHSSNNDVNMDEKDNDTEMSESEMDEYADKFYQQLKNGNQNVRNSEKTYACPYCPKKRKQDYFYHEILQHAVGVGNSPSEKRSVRQKATHMALAKYLENDVSGTAFPSNAEPTPLKPEPSASKTKPPEPVDDPAGNRDHGEKFVWPWTGIVVNIPTTRSADGRFVGGSGSKFRDELISRGFNPIRVHPLWNFRGHSGYAVVEFNKDWPGFHNAISFEKAYELDRHGKREYFAKDVEKIGVYCWVARADDYFADNIIGEHLRKTADLKTISEIMEEESRKTDKLLSNLNNLYETKNRHLKEMESRCNETSASMNKLIEEKDVLLQQYNEEIRKVQANARDHFQRIFNDHEKFKLQLESEKRELELRGSELEKREAKNEIDRRQLSEELEQNAIRNSSLQLAALEQEKADADVMKLVEEQKIEKEKLHKRIIELEKQRDKKQALELEIEEMRGQLNVMNHLVDDGDVEVLKKVEAIINNLKEKEGELEDLEALNQALIIKERNTNDELQEARKELISGLKEISIRAPIRVKRMGELDSKPFLDFVRQKYPEDLAEVKTTELCSLWEEYLKDPGWHPFKTVTTEGTDKEVINEDDERLKNLKNDMGDKVFEAVAAALKEINEYNPSGRYITSELWNYGEGRKATLGEGVSFILQQYRTLKNRRPA